MSSSFFFFFNDTATTEIYTLSLHDVFRSQENHDEDEPGRKLRQARAFERSEEHTSELQSLRHLVCRLLLEKKNKCSATSTSSSGAPDRSKKSIASYAP